MTQGFHRFPQYIQESARIVDYLKVGRSHFILRLTHSSFLGEFATKRLKNAPIDFTMSVCLSTFLTRGECSGLASSAPLVMRR
jgi:hypothetical protein